MEFWGFWKAGKTLPLTNSRSVTLQTSKCQACGPFLCPRAGLPENSLIRRVAWPTRGRVAVRSDDSKTPRHAYHQPPLFDLVLDGILVDEFRGPRLPTDHGALILNGEYGLMS